MNFWNEIKKPIFALAPMEDVTDTAFREIVMSVSDPEYLHILFGEFVSTDGICHKVGRDRVSHRLKINESERKLLKQKNIKIVAQIWGANPEKYSEATKIICEEYDFDGIDINMGCPVKKIVKQGGCSALIGKPDLAKEIIYATKEASNIPVSVKTRTGIKEHITEEWISHILETKPAAITLHGRTQKMMSDSQADWEEIKKAVAVRDASGLDIPLLGNGDVWTMEDAREKIKSTNVDGVMVGRGIFKNPWFFNKELIDLSPGQKLSLLWEHTKLFADTWKDTKNFSILNRFFKIYTFDFYNAAEIRAALMTASNIEEVKKVLEESQYEIDFKD